MPFVDKKSVDIEKIFSYCLIDGKKERITARDVRTYCISPFMLHCDKFVSEDKKDPLSEFDQLLMAQGVVHENQVLREKYPGLEKAKYATLEDGFKLAIEAMKKGSKAISGAPIFWLPEGLTGIVDVLEKRTNASSVFGDYYYAVKEIKLAKNIQMSFKQPTTTLSSAKSKVTHRHHIILSIAIMKKSKKPLMNNLYLS